MYARGCKTTKMALRFLRPDIGLARAKFSPVQTKADAVGRINRHQYAIDFFIVAWSEPFPHECGTTGGCTASEISKAMTTFWVVYFAAIAAASVGILIGKLVNPPGAWYKNLIMEAKLQKLHAAAEESPGWIDDVFIGMKLFWFEALWFKATLMLTCWCAVGVIFAMLSTQVRVQFCH